MYFHPYYIVSSGGEYMTVSETAGSVTVILPDRISEKNATEVRDELLAVVEKNKNKEFFFDCSALIYISSAGLRSLLTVQKRNKKKIILQNTSNEVRDILEVTGFNQILEVEEKIRTINLDECRYLGESVNGTLYRFRSGTMVKIYRDDVTIDDVKKEREQAKNALISGVPTAISFAIVRALNHENNYGIVFEEIEAKTLAQELYEHPDQIIRYADEFGGFMRDLHRIEIDPGMLPSIKSRYRGWLEQVRNKLNHTVWTVMSDLIERMADCNTFVHGDISLNNVFLVDGEMMIMDMASCGYGHPIFDLQSVYATLVAIEKGRPGYCMETMGLKPEFCRSFWQEFIDAYLGNVEKPDEFKSKEYKIVQQGDRMIKADNDKLDTLLEQYYVLKEKLISAL